MSAVTADPGERNQRLVKFRAMVPTDVAAVGSLERAAYAFPWTEGIFRDCLRVGYLCRVAEMEGEVVAYGILALAGVAPHAVQKQGLDLLANKATAVMTNVPGPQQPLYFAGRRIVDLMFWVPQSGDIGMGLSILSYGGGVQFGLITDSLLCPDPEQIINRFAPEFEKLLMTMMMLPWGEQA